MKNPYFNIQTYGCSANQNNSEILAGLLLQSNYQPTNNLKIADILILNTCIVKQKTEDKIKRKIQDLTKKYPKKLLIITGCMPETDAKEIKQLAPKTILLGTKHFKEIVNLIKNHFENQLDWEKQNKYLEYRDEEKVLLPKIPHNKLISITQISEGCLGSCTYCKTRLAKGGLSSYDESKIIESINSDLQSGAKEIWLTSQDLASYSLDKTQTQELPKLLNNILNLKHNFKLRLGMSNPDHLLPILQELIQIYNNKKVYKFLHMPIQSASNKILKHMKRKYTLEQAEQIINVFRKTHEDITIATDIIVGYPIETKQDHQANIDFIGKYKPDVLNISKFSSHKNTEVSKFATIDIKTINKRTAELMELHKRTALENKRKFLGKTVKVFVNQKTKIPYFYEARDENYNIVFVRSGDNLLGKILNVKINRLGVHYMFGDIEGI